MDSLTHALAISVVFAAAGRHDLVPFAVLGAVIPDIDVVFQRFSDRYPRLYIFTHGGITHSIAGAVAIAVLSAIAGLVLVPVALPAYGAINPALTIGTAVAGVLSHIILDYLAYPGIPLLYPLTDRKFTLGIMAGPSIFLTIASVSYLLLIMAGVADIAESWPYALFFTAVILTCASLKVYVDRRVDGRTIPGFIPVSWLAISETSDAISVHKYDLVKGPGENVRYEKYRGRSPGLQPESESPELRRMRYHSYAVTEEHDGDTVRYVDPLREHGYLWYPPYFKSVRVPVKKVHGR
ncbi:metal-dependent hydrolase [Methanocella sp. MCL-LM]|uniref:metal-dependent hydrolase n=1 Tax=Methanocella sp. MCL-LM TaxID=3412035 RepID=UPI003C726C91